jgi:hypothetical protein
MLARFCRALAAAGAVALCAAAAPLSAQRAIPTPSSILGFEPGADRHLPSWKQIVDHFTALDKASPRVSVRTLGKTTLGRPFIVAFISDSSTLANLDHYRQLQRKLMDPRLQAAGERETLIDQGKNVSSSRRPFTRRNLAASPRRSCSRTGWRARRTVKRKRFSPTRF